MERAIHINERLGHWYRVGEMFSFYVDNKGQREYCVSHEIISKEGNKGNFSKGNSAFLLFLEGKTKEDYTPILSELDTKNPGFVNSLAALLHFANTVDSKWVEDLELKCIGDDTDITSEVMPTDTYRKINIPYSEVVDPEAKVFIEKIQYGPVFTEFYVNNITVTKVGYVPSNEVRSKQNDNSRGKVLVVEAIALIKHEKLGYIKLGVEVQVGVPSAVGINSI